MELSAMAAQARCPGMGCRSWDRRRPCPDKSKLLWEWAELRWAATQLTPWCLQPHLFKEKELSATAAVVLRQAVSRKPSLQLPQFETHMPLQRWGGPRRWTCDPQFHDRQGH